MRTTNRDTARTATDKNRPTAVPLRQALEQMVEERFLKLR